MTLLLGGIYIIVAAFLFIYTILIILTDVKNQSKYSDNDGEDYYWSNPVATFLVIITVPLLWPVALFALAVAYIIHCFMHRNDGK